MASATRHLRLHHVEIYVEEFSELAGTLRHALGFDLRSDRRSGSSVTLVQGNARLVLTSGEGFDDRPGRFVRGHGYGVADIALRTPDVHATLRRALSRGARLVQGPTVGPASITASINTFGDVVHSLIEYIGNGPAVVDVRSAPVGTPSRPDTQASGTGLTEIDHLAVCVEAGQLDEAVAFYTDALDFDMIFTEIVRVGTQGMNSACVRNARGDLTLTIIEPDPDGVPGQIDDFLARHGGSGVQHIAFGCDDIVHAVSTLAARGVPFLDTPDSYYAALASRLTPKKYSTDELRRHRILVDEDGDGQLLQIFSRSTHPRKTFFFEFVERLGARTFGSGNIHALYRALEDERTSAPRDDERRQSEEAGRS